MPTYTDHAGELLRLPTFSDGACEGVTPPAKPTLAGRLCVASRLPEYQAAIGPRREFDPANPIVRGALLRLGISAQAKACDEVPKDPPPDDDDDVWEPPPPPPDPPPPTTTLGGVSVVPTLYYGQGAIFLTGMEMRVSGVDGRVDGVIDIPERYQKYLPNPPGGFVNGSTILASYGLTKPLADVATLPAAPGEAARILENGYPGFDVYSDEAAFYSTVYSSAGNFLLVGAYLVFYTVYIPTIETEGFSSQIYPEPS